MLGNEVGAHYKGRGYETWRVSRYSAISARAHSRELRYTQPHVPNLRHLQVLISISMIKRILSNNLGSNILRERGIVEPMLSISLDLYGIFK